MKALQTVVLVLLLLASRLAYGMRGFVALRRLSLAADFLSHSGLIIKILFRNKRFCL